MPSNAFMIQHNCNLWLRDEWDWLLTILDLGLAAGNHGESQVERTCIDFRVTRRIQEDPGGFIWFNVRRMVAIFEVHCLKLPTSLCCYRHGCKPGTVSDRVGCSTSW